MNIEQDLEIILRDFKKNHLASMFRDKTVYADLLAQTYYFVCHSTALLGYALPHLKNAPLRHHFEKHISEEEKHELLALKDIERMGLDIKHFSEYTSTQAFYQSQYYRIQFEGGTSLLGYILFLEAVAVSWGKEVYEEIKDIHKGSTLFIKVHADEDPDHLDNALGAIKALPVDQQEAIRKNLYYSYEMYQQILQNIVTNKAQLRAA